MTALQNIIKEAKSMRAKYPKKYNKWTDYVKAASKNYAAKNKSIAKKPTEKVILKKVHSAKQSSKNLFNQLDKLDEAQHKHMMGALPIGFKGSILGVNFKVINQFDIYNNVNCIIENTKNGDLITIVTGNSLKKNDVDFLNYIYYFTKDKTTIDKKIQVRISKFLANLNTEVKKYNAGNKLTTKKDPVIIKKTVKKAVVKIPSNKNTLTKIKEVLREDKKRLKGGYAMKPGKVRIGAINTMAIGDYKKNCELLNRLEKVKINYKLAISNKKNKPNDILILKKQLISLDKYIAELKIHVKELKKII